MKIAVLGDGGWGTAVAMLLNGKKYRVYLWSAFPDYAEFLNKNRENTKFLPSFKIPSEIVISADLAEVVKDAKLIVLAIPSHVMRKVIAPLKDFDLSQSIILSLSKGIENEKLMRMSEVINEEIKPRNLAVLSGPSHAEEVARNLPTAVVVSSPSQKIAVEVQTIFMTERFRVYTNPDVVGVELGGALKNIIAIAAGISDGLEFGANTKAAILIRGMTEMVRLGVNLGANANTFSGLSGMGDLIATCSSPYSRNKRVGELLAKGRKLEQLLSETEMVAEGVETARSVHNLAQKQKIEMPITQEIYSILYNGKEPLSVVRDLMARKAKPELEE